MTYPVLLAILTFCPFCLPSCLTLSGKVGYLAGTKKAISTSVSEFGCKPSSSLLQSRAH